MSIATVTCAILSDPPCNAPTPPSAFPPPTQPVPLLPALHVAGHGRSRRASRKGERRGEGASFRGRRPSGRPRKGGQRRRPTHEHGRDRRRSDAPASPP